MKVLLLLALSCLAACSWLGGKRAVPADPTELIVTGAPLGSIIVVDGVKVSSTPTLDPQPQTIRVAPGDHQVEIHLGDPVVYREEIYVRRGEQRFVKVLSGSGR